MQIVLTERAPTAGSNGSVVGHFGFKVRDIAATLAKWRQDGYEVQGEFTGAEGFPNAYLMGPDSVRLELQEDTTLTRDVIGHHVHFNSPDFEADVGVVRGDLRRNSLSARQTCYDRECSRDHSNFSNAAQPTAATRGRAFDPIGFEFAHLDSVYESLLQQGIEFAGPPCEVPSVGLKIVFLTDPWSGYVELTEGLVDY